MPLSTRSRSSLKVEPSKGRDPLTNVYNITPNDQTSTSGPSYFLPWKSSGAAYGGLPQNVSSLEPGVNSFENPKSAIFIFNSLSNNKFSAFKSLFKRIIYNGISLYVFECFYIENEHMLIKQVSFTNV